jgi:hypothetical protein
MVPKAMKPATLWGWWQYVGIDSAKASARVLEETFRAMPGYSREAHVAWTFVNYPLEMKPRDPAGSLSLTCKTERLEWYGFRNKWQGDDVCLFQVAVDAENRGAGAFRLSGFGTSWLAGKPGRRSAENVVQLPGIEVDEDAAARVTHYETGENGSGSLTLDYGPVYRTAETGVSGSRAMAVDYSGKSGATAMVVIADRVDGFDAPVWSCPFLDFATGLGRFKTGSKYRKEAPKGTDTSYAAVAKKFYGELLREARGLREANRDYKAYAERRSDLMSQFSIEGDTLRMSGEDGVVLQMRFFSNAPVVLRNDELEKAGLAAKMTIIYSLTSGIVARGGDEFLVVITLSKGAPPTIDGTPGQGLKTRVKVGSRTVQIEEGNVTVR